MGRNEDILESYSGAKVLNFLCDYTSLSIDQINFISCQLVALILSCVLKKWISNPLTRLWYCFVCGIAMCVFCFGTQTFHIIISAGLSYLVIRNTKSSFTPWIVFVVSMAYLSFLHLKRQFYEQSHYALDITGPLMVLTQKVTSLAFAIRDGLELKKEQAQRAKEPTELQKKFAISSVPSTLTFCSYVFQFQSMLAGPLVFYHDYMEFIEKEESPSPLTTVVKKVLMSIVVAFLFLNFHPGFKIEYLREAEFMDQTSFLYKVFYITVATTLERCKYYHAWILADAVCNASGLGYDKAKQTWNLVSNVEAVSFELGLNLKESLDCWNIGTMKWLRYVIYERASPSTRTGLVYLVSAFWHGFYPGYYITFISGALFTYAARTIRRSVRPLFMGGSFALKRFYDLTTWTATRLVVGYVTFSFVVQDFLPSFDIFMRLYFFLHIAASLAFLAPAVTKKFIRHEPKVSSKKEGIYSLSDNSLNKNGGMPVITDTKPKFASSDRKLLSFTEIIRNDRDAIDKARFISSSGSPILNTKESYENDINNEAWSNRFINNMNGAVKLKTG